MAHHHDGCYVTVYGFTYGLHNSGYSLEWIAVDRYLGAGHIKRMGCVTRTDHL